jgi:hypothetical protein
MCKRSGFTTKYGSGWRFATKINYGMGWEINSKKSTNIPLIIPRVCLKKNDIKEMGTLASWNKNILKGRISPAKIHNMWPS